MADEIVVASDNNQKPKEEWRVLPLDETVQLSSLGRVRRNGRIKRKFKPDRDGYLRLTVKGKSYRLHRLIADIFIKNPNPEEYTVVDHINNIKNDNRVENLRWVSVQMNTQYAADMGLLNRIKNDKSVIICWNEKTFETYLFTTIADCCRKLNLNRMYMSRVCVGKTNSYKGYKCIRATNLEDLRRDENGRIIR